MQISIQCLFLAFGGTLDGAVVDADINDGGAAALPNSPSEYEEDDVVFSLIEPSSGVFCFADIILSVSPPLLLLLF